MSAVPYDATSRVAAWWRLFWVGGRISFRALFNWMHPAMYIPTMLGSPLFQILFFVYLGRYAELQDDAFYATGNAIQVCGMAGIYGACMAVANERHFGTLSSLLATPANRAALFLGRAVPVIGNGLLVSAFGFAVALLLLDFRPPLESVPAIAFVTFVCASSCTALGMLIGSIGLRARDVFFGANLVYFLLLLFAGVNIPIADLPGWMQSVAQVIPLTHGIEAARELGDGAAFSSVADLVATEALIGLAYAAAAFTLFRYFERSGRRSGTLDTF